MNSDSTSDVGAEVERFMRGTDSERARRRGNSSASHRLVLCREVGRYLYP